MWLTRTAPDTPIPDYINDPVGVLREMQANALQAELLSHQVMVWVVSASSARKRAVQQDCSSDSMNGRRHLIAKSCH